MKLTIDMFSDTHGLIPLSTIRDQFREDADLVVFAGDGIDEGLIQFMMSLPHPYKIIVAGNHDFEVFNKEILIRVGIIYLENESVEIEGEVIYGSPYTPRFGNWAFMDEDENLCEIWDKISDDTSVLITHGPMHGVRDMNIEGHCCGSQSLKNRISALNDLELHIFGHIHEAHGMSRIGNVQHHNVSLLNRDYIHTNKVSHYGEVFEEKEERGYAR